MKRMTDNTHIRPGDRRLFGGSIAEVVAVGTEHRSVNRPARTEGRTTAMPVVLVRCSDFDDGLIRLEDVRAVGCLGPTVEELDAIDDVNELDELTWDLAGRFMDAEDNGEIG